MSMTDTERKTEAETQMHIVARRLMHRHMHRNRHRHRHDIGTHRMQGKRRGWGATHNLTLIRTTVHAFISPPQDFSKCQNLV